MELLKPKAANTFITSFKRNSFSRTIDFIIIAEVYTQASTMKNGRVPEITFVNLKRNKNNEINNRK